jgi:hypothetical protein
MITRPLTGWPRMTRNITLSCLALCLLFVPPSLVYEAHGKDVLPVLEAAESLFKAMKARNYPKTWDMLTLKSREGILDDVHKTVVKDGAKISRDDLRADFASGGPYATAYWGAYLNVFDPDSVLEHSKWDKVKANTNDAEVILHHKKSDHPAILKLFRENGAWKVGLEETFRPRRWLNP